MRVRFSSLLPTYEHVVRAVHESDLAESLMRVGSFISRQKQHGIAAGASGLQPGSQKMQRVPDLWLLAPCGIRLAATSRRCQRRDRGFESRLPPQVSEAV